VTLCRKVVLFFSILTNTIIHATKSCKKHNSMKTQVVFENLKLNKCYICGQSRKGEI